MNLIEFISAFGTVFVSTALGALAGSWAQKRKYQHEKMQERYDHLYAPFVKLLLSETHGAFLFTDLDNSLQRRFTDILLQNYQYSDTDLQDLIYFFQNAYDNRHKYSDNDANQYFFDIANDIFSTYKLMNQKLYYESKFLKRKKRQIEKRILKTVEKHHSTQDNQAQNIIQSKDHPTIPKTNMPSEITRVQSLDTEK